MIKVETIEARGKMLTLHNSGDMAVITVEGVPITLHPDDVVRLRTMLKPYERYATAESEAI